MYKRLAKYGAWAFGIGGLAGFDGVGHQSYYLKYPEAWKTEVADFLKRAGVLLP